MKKSIKLTSKASKPPLVSIIIPCFNHGQYLKDSIGSIRQQTYSSIEIILVNDGSTEDRTNKIIDKIEQEQVDIQVINQKNKGLVGARNSGVKRAAGDYIICLDADDKLDKNYVKKTMEVLLANPDVAIVTTWLQEFGDRNGVWETIDYDPGKLLVANGLHAGSLYRREVWESVGGYNPIMKYGYEDWEFWIAAAERGYKWATLKEPLFIYRTQQGSMLSKTVERHQEVYAKIFELHQSMFERYLPDVISHYCALVTELRRSNKDKSVAIAEQQKHLDSLQKRLDSLQSDYDMLVKETSSTLVKTAMKTSRFLEDSKDRLRK